VIKQARQNVMAKTVIPVLCYCFEKNFFIQENYAKLFLISEKFLYPEK
jgi:hypothetical protein